MAKDTAQRFYIGIKVMDQCSGVGTKMWLTKICNFISSSINHNSDCDDPDSELYFFLVTLKCGDTSKLIDGTMLFTASAVEVWIREILW